MHQGPIDPNKSSRAIPAPSQASNGSLPFSDDAEKGVVSALLQAPRKAFNLIPSLHPEAFYVPAHRMIFEILQELIARGEAADPNAPIDFVRLKQALSDRQQLVEVGGDQFLNELYGFTTAPDAVQWYAETILDHYGRRRLILACKQIGQLATDRTISSDGLLGKADTELTEVSAAFVGSNATSQEMTVDELIGFDRENDPDSVMGNRWLSRGDSLLISGPTGIGKSSFAIQAVIN